VWDYWQDFQQVCAKTWGKWHKVWLERASNPKTPIYFFRFEDVLADPLTELTNLYKFMLGMESLEGTVIEQRIKEVVGMGKDAS
jgi:hypothetical protein